MRKLEEPAPVFHIRAMEPVDLPAVDALERAAFRNPWSLELMRRELTHEWSTIYLAEEADAAGGKRLLGFMVFWLVHDEVHVLNVAVAPAQRRRGVGRALLQAALERGRRHRCVLATLEARRSNAAALGLYKSFGFREVGVRPNYYADDGEDAIVMVADL